MSFDAVIHAASPHAHDRVLGLTLVERGRRVAKKAGARRVFVVEDGADADALRAWGADLGGVALLVMRAGDQVVHMPLVEALEAGAGDRRVAVGADGEEAGALWAVGDAAREALDAIAAAPGDGDRALARRWRSGGDATAIVHGPIARHAAATPQERAAASRMLLGILVKAEDGPVTRYLYRPVSRPLSRLLVRTPITPNQISIAVGVIGLVGCWITARPSQTSLIIGAALVLAAGFLDGCDGELARLRLTSSRVGAWIDTVVDELTSAAYLAGLGVHTARHLHQAWVLPSLAVGLAFTMLGVAGIYHFLAVVSRTGNSQHYVERLELVDDPIAGVGLRALPAKTNRPRWVRAIGYLLVQAMRRDFINLLALLFACLDLYLPGFLLGLVGSVGLFVTVVPAHLRLRRQLRAIRDRGAIPRLA